MTPTYLFIAAILWSILSGVAVFLLIKFLDHEKRIQRLEDTTNRDVQELKQDLKDLKVDMNKKFDELTTMVHKDKNMESQLNQTLTLILKHLSNEESRS